MMGTRFEACTDNNDSVSHPSTTIFMSVQVECGERQTSKQRRRVRFCLGIATWSSTGRRAFSTTRLACRGRGGLKFRIRLFNFFLISGPLLLEARKTRENSMFVSRFVITVLLFWSSANCMTARLSKISLMPSSGQNGQRTDRFADPGQFNSADWRPTLP